MFGISVIVCTLLPVLALSDPTRPLEKRQSCPASCSGCCDALPPAGCYAPVSGPGAGQYACYSYPPGEVVSTQYLSGSYSASYPAASSGYYSSSQPYGSYSSSAGYPQYSSYYSSYNTPVYPSSSQGFGIGPAYTPHHSKTPAVASSAGAAASSAIAPPGSSDAGNNNVAIGVLMVVCSVVGLAVLL